MGIFSKKENCSICQKNIGSKQLMDGCACKECVRKCGTYILQLSWKDVSVDKVKKAIQANDRNNNFINLFKATKKVDKYLEIDENHNLWRVPQFDTIYTFDEIISFELVEDGVSLTKGGLGSAIVGGALFGGVGAIVGGVTGTKKGKTQINQYQINIVTRNELKPQAVIYLLTAGPVKTGSFLYNTYKNAAQKIITELTVITDHIKSQNNTNSVTAPSGADEIVKYKNLYDQGIITQEEFEAKKKQLLGL